MTFVSTLTFSGIDFLAVDRPQRMIHALMPDGHEARVARNPDHEGRPVIIPPHLAYVRFDMADLDPSSGRDQRTPDIVFESGGRKLGVCFLSRETVEVEGPIESSGVSFESTLQEPSTEPSSAGRLTFNEYVIDFLSACGVDYQGIDRALVEPESSGAQANLAALVRIRHGHFAASHVDPAHIWTFDPNAQRQPYYCMAQEVPVTFRVTDNRFSLRFQPFAGQERPATALHFARPDGSPINVRLGNAPLDAIVMRSQCIDDSVDYHFELYYTLIPRLRDLPRIPRKRLVEKEPHAANCPLVRGLLTEPLPQLAKQTTSASATTGARTFAIHAGVGGVDPLADIKAWSDLTSSYDHQVLLPKRECTTAAFRAALERAGGWLHDGGLLFVTFSGHGARYPQLHDRMLTADELRSMWARFPAGARIVFLADSCHSGALSASRAESPADVLLLAACDEDGVAYDSGAVNESAYFTAMMKRAIAEAPGARLRSQFDRAAHLLQEVVPQTPRWIVMNGEGKAFEELVMF